MLRSNDFFAVIRRSGYVAPILIFISPPFRLLILISIFLLFLLERRTKLSRKVTHSQTGPSGIGQQDELLTQPLPLWVGCLLLTENLFIEEEMVLLRHPVYLSATRQGYSLIYHAESQVKWLEYCSEGVVLLLFILPTLSIFIPFMPFAVGMSSGAILCQIYLRVQAFDRYLRVEESERLETSGTQEFPRLRTFRSYLPQEKVPAFAWRSWRGQEIYLDVRLLETAPASIIRTLLMHEQGHIMLGHTTLMFLLRCCRYVIVIIGLLTLSVFSTTLAQMSGLGTIPWLLAFIGGLLAPDIVKLIFQDVWEQQADQWASARLDQRAIYTARLYVKSRYQGR